MRELQCELGLLQKADGSATFQHGETKILCAVYGPAEVKQNKEIIDKATLECILKPKVKMAGVKEKSLEEIIMNSCKQVVITKQHPRSAIQIVLQIMQDSGSLLSTLINGVTMAMVHAGLPMQCMMVGVCCAIRNNGEFLVDPTSKDEENSRCTFSFVFESKNFELISSYTTGTYTIEEFFRCLQFSQMSAKDVSTFQRLSVQRFLSKQVAPMENVENAEEEPQNVVSDDAIDEDVSSSNE